MLVAERQQRIVTALHSDGTVRVKDLSTVLGVSEGTIRRDLDVLEREGVLRKVYGGATLPVPEGAGAPASRVPTDEAVSRVGVLIPSSPYYQQVLAGMRKTTARLGVRAALALSSYVPEQDDEHIARMISDGVDGLLVCPAVDEQGWLARTDRLDELGVPVVLLERRTRQACGVDQVMTDHEGGAQLAVRHLAGLGHSRIALLTKYTSPTAPWIRLGYAAGLRETGASGPPVADVLQGESADREPVAQIREHVRDLLDAGTTAMLVHSDREALTVLQVCRELGVRVPDDLALVSYDDDFGAFGTVPLTAIAPAKWWLGQIGMELLVSHLRQDPDRPVQQVMLSPSLIVRESCGAAQS